MLQIILRILDIIELAALIIKVVLMWFTW